MTLQPISRHHAVLRQARIMCARQIALAEETLYRSVVAFLDSRPESLREMARVMGFSVAYLSDIRHGRRKVSDEVVERLGRLK